jgi:hypothetical protein
MGSNICIDHKIVDKMNVSTQTTDVGDLDDTKVNEILMIPESPINEICSSFNRMVGINAKFEEVIDVLISQYNIIKIDPFIFQLNILEDLGSGPLVDCVCIVMDKTTKVWRATHKTLKIRSGMMRIKLINTTSDDISGAISRIKDGLSGIDYYNFEEIRKIIADSGLMNIFVHIIVPIMRSNPSVMFGDHIVDLVDCVKILWNNDWIVSRSLTPFESDMFRV